MNQVAIQASGLGKQYVRGTRRPARAHELIEKAVRGAFQKFEMPNPKFWAVQECTFTIRQGEIVGLVGCNGAGKSVLLKMLARVVHPSSGQALIRGRMRALLELGSGFHPEMTGRENVFFNGSVLGVRRKEMERKLDEIVEFSGVAEFLDTPVKYYSSGMYMRLAFSVAAHMETDILLLDEVLTVGDASFHEKCLDRMRFAASQGTTILMVSHDMKNLGELCTRGLYLEQGRLLFDGSFEEAAGLYRRSTGIEAVTAESV